MNLAKKQYVLKVSEKSITFNHELKELFIDEYLAGKLPKQIFEEAGFDIDIDITYLPHNGKDIAYLSTILDASTGQILAHHMSKRITLDIAIDTIKKLINQRKVKLTKDVIVHSDQGFHYTSPTYQNLLKQNGLWQSMSRRGNCWDNAPQESFFGHLKDSIDLTTCKKFDDLEGKINNYIRYYNNYRYQWGLKRMTPAQFRNHLLSA